MTHTVSTNAFINQRNCIETFFRSVSLGIFFVSTFIVFLAGIWLRCRRIGAVQIFADEFHTLQLASEKSFLWNFTHYAPSDACIPYTLYNKLLLENTWLTELTLRLPSVLAGILLLGVVFWYGRKYANSAVALAVTGFLSVSPYFVYIAREARPYAIIMLLFTWAGFILMDKVNCQRLISMCAASIMLALAVYFHPVVLPGAIVIWCSPVILNIRSPDLNKHWIRNYGVATLVGIGIGVITIGLALPSFFEVMSHKTSTGRADIRTVRDGLLLIHAMPVFVPVWVWFLAVVGGLLGCLRGWVRQGIIVLIAVSVQILAIHVANPRLDQIPWVWLRYWIHVFPLLIVFWGVGISRLLKPFDKATWILVSCCSLILGAYGCYHVTKGNYCISGADTYPVHPMVMMLNQISIPHDQIPVRRFYEKMIAHLDKKSIIIESPRIYTFPLYGRYSPIHHHNIKTAGVPPGFAQRMFEKNNNFKFETVFRPGRDDLPGESVYWIHHYNIKQELSQWLALSGSDPYASSQLASADFLMKKPLVDELFGADEILERFSPPGGKLIYQDDFVKLFQINGRGKIGKW